MQDMTALRAAVTPASVPSPEPVRVGLLGLGTVGSGVVRLLAENRDAIERRVGRRIELGPVVVRDPNRARSVQVPRDMLTTDAGAVLDDPSVRIVVEVMGGVHPALEYILRALRSGKAVVTANKDVIAEHGQRVFAAADAGGADVFFEAAVAGGIPIIRSLKESLAGNRIRRLAGILNGTTNYILTRMEREGVNLDQAVAEAQRLGYAEADPSADVEGWDAARKLAILASIAFSSRFLPRHVYREGIGAVSHRDIAHGERMGWSLKLLAIAEHVEEGVRLRVHPAFVPRQHPLASVHDTFNAIYVQGDAVGDAMFYGRGAGSLPTASAVVGDLMEAVRFIDRGGKGLSCTCVYRIPALSMAGSASRFYVRLEVKDRPGVLAQIAGVLGRAGVNIESVLQSPVGEDQAELVLVTHRVAEERMARALRGLRRLESVERVAAAFRVAPEDL
jgi:homoserine dehydrogenase